MTAPEVTQLLEVGRDLAWPGVAGLVNTGEAAWRAVVVRLVPLERIRLLGAVSGRMLTITPGGQRRLVEWEATRSAAPALSPAAFRRRIRNALTYFGDAPMLDVAVEALAVLPPPVLAMALEEVALAGVGWSAGGWRTGGQLLGPNGLPRRQLIVVSGAYRDADRLRRVLLHELAHAWDHDPIDRETGDPAALAIGEAAVQALAHEQGWAAAAAAHIATSERRADALALAWACAAS